MNKLKDEDFRAIVRWHPLDIQELRPKWSIKTCKEWLEDNDGHIQDAMTEAGWDAIKALL